MARAIWDNYLGGLAPFSDRLALPGSFAEGRDIDAYRFPGYLSPGFAESQDVSGTLVDTLIDVVIDKNSTAAYAIGGEGNLYKLTAAALTTTALIRAKATSGATRGESVFMYPIGTTNYLFYVYEDDIGRFDLASTYDDDFMSTVPAGAASLGNNPHPTIEGEDKKMYIGDGNDVASFDGTNGANGTFVASAIDLPEGWEISSLFKTKNMLGICAWREVSPGTNYRTECGVFLWDYVSPSFVTFIPIEDNFIEASLNANGVVYLLTKGTNFSSSLRILTDTGSVLITPFHFDIGGTTHDFTGGSTPRNSLEFFNNRILCFLTSGTKNYVFAYGTTSPLLQASLYPIASGDDGSGSRIGIVKQLFAGSIYLSYNDGTNDIYSRFPGNASTDADWKASYVEADLNRFRKLYVNWIKVYMAPLVASDDFTIGMDVDYGTSVTLTGGQITHTSLGAITEHEIKVNKECHAFRPTITWDAGTVKVARLVVDYDFIE